MDGTGPTGTRFGADPRLFGGIYQEILPAGAYHDLRCSSMHSMIITTGSV